MYAPLITNVRRDFTNFLPIIKLCLSFAYIHSVYIPHPHAASLTAHKNSVLMFFNCGTIYYKLLLLRKFPQGSVPEARGALGLPVFLLPRQREHQLLCASSNRKRKWHYALGKNRTGWWGEAFAFASNCPG